MSARRFFDTVAKPNALDACESFWMERAAVNAIMTLDACIGIMHDELFQQGRAKAKDDSAFREAVAEREPRYRIIRDAAFALKHGTLSKKKPRLVLAAANIGSDDIYLDDGFFVDHDFIDGQAVFIMVEGSPRQRAEFLIGPVMKLIDDLLTEHQL